MGPSPAGGHVGMAGGGESEGRLFEVSLQKGVDGE